MATIRHIRKHNLSIGTDFKRGKGISMSITPKKVFEKGEKIYAIYRRIPMRKNEKTEFTILRPAEFTWLDSNNKEILKFKVGPFLSTHYSILDTSDLPTGKYTVQYKSDDKTIHERLTFIIHDPDSEINSLKETYTTQILESLSESPKSIDDLKKICGVTP